MKTLKILALICALALLVLSFAGCGESQNNPEGSTASSVTADTSVADSEAASVNAEAEGESEAGSKNNNTPEASESGSEISDDDNDLEIMTVPDAELTEGEKSENDTQPAETSAPSTETFPAFNDDEPIELPFVPAE